MSSPVARIDVVCPACGHKYQDWYRASLNFMLETFSDDYVRQASTATCPECEHVVDLSILLVSR